jgi:hypothetical protein
MLKLLLGKKFITFFTLYHFLLYEYDPYAENDQEEVGVRIMAKYTRPFCKQKCKVN